MDRSVWRLAAGLCLLLGGLSVAPPARSQTCGPICSRPGHYVLCSDSFDATAATGGSFALAEFPERLCVGHAAPAATYNLRGAYTLLTPGGLVSFCLELFEESFATAPTRPIAASVNAQCFTTGTISGTGWVEFSLNPAAAYQNLSVPLRLCLTDQSGSSQRHTYFDADGVSGYNTVYLNPPRPFGWALASDRGVPGDFIFRPIVELSDLTPWQAGGQCTGGTPDAGPSDTGVHPDAGAADAEPSDAEPSDADSMDAEPGAELPLDAGTPVDLGGPNDAAGPAEDAAAPSDSGAFDASSTESDAGLPSEAPSISAITPSEGLGDRAIDVLVTGTGFASGATLRIGQIPAVSVSVPGTTTLLAKVPPGIAAGTYDVTVQNPDLQAAVLPQGYTVLDPDGPGNLPEDDCGCQTAGRGAPRSGLLGLLLLALFVGLRAVAPKLARARVPLARRSKTS